ncbi:MAG: gamma-glutamylcyclotransferase family protein [Microcoleaceae cyanobacterium]
MNWTRVFVYGTLKPGERNYQHYCQPYVVHTQAAIASGQLFQLPMGYPAMVPGEGVVQGVILSFADASILQALDRLEDYDPQRPPEQNEYQRQQIQTYNVERQPLSRVWAYTMTLKSLQRFKGVVLIPTGCWSSA